MKVTSEVEPGVIVLVCSGHFCQHTFFCYGQNEWIIIIPKTHKYIALIDRNVTQSVQMKPNVPARVRLLTAVLANKTFEEKKIKFAVCPCMDMLVTLEPNGADHH